MKLGLWFAIGGVLAALGRCSVGAGSGSATGPLFVVSCNNGYNLGMPPTGSGYMGAPIPYSLSPTFFAGVPSEDLIQGPGAMNVLSMRMASSGLLEMYTDFLEFDVVASRLAISVQAVSTICSEYGVASRFGLAALASQRVRPLTSQRS